MTEHLIFDEVLIILIAAVISVPIFHRLGLGPVLGYLVAGVIIGPSGLALIEAAEDIHQVAELGVVFLLFAIGLELKLQRLWVMRRHVFGLGGLQIVITMAVLALLAGGLGLGAEEALIAGGALAFSSTAVVLQTLTDRGELNTRTGRVAFAVLLMQDLAVVPLLALVPMLAGDMGSVTTAMGLAVVQAGLVLLGIVAIGRFLLRPLLKLIASTRSTEIFAAAAVLLVLGTSWLTAQAGLSMALGAFLAGLMLAETEFRHQVEADIQPFRGFLLGLFFITVGMSVDLGLVVREGFTVGAIVVVLLVVKALLIVLLGLAFRLGRSMAVQVGLLLAQGGEFAFVLLGLAAAEGIMQRESAQLLILSVSLTMIVTPLLAVAAARVADRLGDTHQVAALHLEGAGEMHDHVIIAGFGRVGQTVARMLEAAGIPYIALDLHADRVAEGLARGLPVFYADASRPEVLRLAGAAHARAAVITMDHPALAERAVTVLRQSFPQLKVFARARDQHHSAVLDRAGASRAVPETLEASLQLGAILLRSVGTSTSEVGSLLEAFRADDYAALENLLPARSSSTPRPGAENGTAAAKQ